MPAKKEVEGEIAKEEIVKAIKKLKKRKSAGLCGIPNEAWIYEAEIIRGELKDYINKV